MNRRGFLGLLLLPLAAPALPLLAKAGLFRPSLNAQAGRMRRFSELLEEGLSRVYADVLTPKEIAEAFDVPVELLHADRYGVVLEWPLAPWDISSIFPGRGPPCSS